MRSMDFQRNTFPEHQSSECVLGQRFSGIEKKNIKQEHLDLWANFYPVHTRPI